MKFIMNQGGGVEFASSQQNQDILNVKENGDVLIKGIGGYDGTNPSSAQTVNQVIDSKYTKPSDGIPASDIASGVIPVEKGTGVNSIVPTTVFGELTSVSHNATISGDANATSYTVNMRGPSMSTILAVGSKISLDGETNIAKVLSISGSTIVVDKTLSNTAISNYDMFYTTRPYNSQCTASGNYSTAIGFGTVAEGDASISHGYNVMNSSDANIKASGIGSHAEGYVSYSVISAEGVASHAKGYSVNNSKISAKGNGSNAEGYTNYGGKISAEGIGSHAEGNSNSSNITASGKGSHAEGSAAYSLSIIASGEGSHAEGYTSRGQYSYGNITAIGPGSHAEGVGTNAQNFGEHAEGCCNKSNKASATYGNAGNTQHSVGIGTSDNDRKNAFEIMQNGDVYMYGVGGYDGTNAGTSGVSTIQRMMLSPLNIKLFDSVAPIDYIYLSEEVINDVYLIDINDEPSGLASPFGCVYNSRFDEFFPRVDDVSAKEINNNIHISDMIERNLSGSSFEVTNATSLIIFCNYFRHNVSFDEINGVLCVAALYFYSENSGREMIAFYQFEL